MPAAAKPKKPKLKKPKKIIYPPRCQFCNVRQIDASYNLEAHVAHRRPIAWVWEVSLVPGAVSLRMIENGVSRRYTMPPCQAKDMAKALRAIASPEDGEES